MTGHRIMERRWLVALSIGVAIAGAVVGLRLTGALQPLELDAYDTFLRLRSGEPAAATTPIVLVRIYEDDIRRFGHPLCDELLARAIGTLLEGEPRVLGIDLYRDAPVPRVHKRMDARR